MPQKHSRQRDHKPRRMEIRTQLEGFKREMAKSKKVWFDSKVIKWLTPNEERWSEKEYHYKVTIFVKN